MVMKAQNKIFEKVIHEYTYRSLNCYRSDLIKVGFNLDNNLIR